MNLSTGSKSLAVELEGIEKTYRVGNTVVNALRGVSLTAREGEYIAITGSSGSGKSSLLHIIGCLDTQSAGRYSLHGVKVENMADKQLSEIRNQMIGFVFQSFYLMPQFTVIENIEIPLLYRGVERNRREELVITALEKMGLGDRLSHKSHELSGGERQRVAIARALVTGPRLLLADEPTGNLDFRTGNEIMDILQTLNDEGVTVILVTHDLEKARRADRIFEMRDGLIASTQDVH